MIRDNRPSMHVVDKARAIVAADGVEQIPGTQYRVTSGERDYRVLWSWEPICTCVASGHCSHIEAVRIAVSAGKVRKAA